MAVRVAHLAVVGGKSLLPKAGIIPELAVLIGHTDADIEHTLRSIMGPTRAEEFREKGGFDLLEWRLSKKIDCKSINTDLIYLILRILD